jgi:hypothetical protein
LTEKYGGITSAVHALAGQRLAGHAARGDLGQRLAGGLG